MLTVFFLAVLTAQPVQGAVPSVAIVSQLQCGSARFAVLQVSNRSANESIFFPLSPLYAQGFTVHNVRLEVEDEGKWHLVGRGSDIPGSGVRELRPGERFLDFFLLPTPEQAATLKGSPMRLVIPYKIGDSFEQVSTGAFNIGDLPVRNDASCPATLNASSSAK
jgi:hypothetical protein